MCIIEISKTRPQSFLLGQNKSRASIIHSAYSWSFFCCSTMNRVQDLRLQKVEHSKLATPELRCQSFSSFKTLLNYYHIFTSSKSSNLSYPPPLYVCTNHSLSFRKTISSNLKRKLGSGKKRPQSADAMVNDHVSQHMLFSSTF